MRFELRRLGVLVAVIALSLAVGFAQSPDRVEPKPDVTMRVVVREGATASSADLGTLKP